MPQNSTTPTLNLPKMRYCYTKGLLSMLMLMTLASVAMAQQLPMSSLYFQNRFMINPAAAGYEDGLVGHLNFRNQWAGMKGSPTTGWLNLHAPLGKNTNIGGGVVYDQTDLISTLNVQLAYAHNIRLTKEHYISLGISAGVHSVQFNLNDAIVEDPTDIILANGNVGNTTLALDAGIRYHWKGLEVGAAVPNMLENLGQFKSSDVDFRHDITRHYRFYATYDYMIKNINIVPMGMVRWLPDAPVSWDAAVKIGYKRIVWGSVMWRAETGPVAGIGFRIADKFSFAYAYDFSLNNIDGNTWGNPWSNEIMVSFHLDGFKKRFKKLEDRMDEMDQERGEVLDILDSLQTALNAKMDSLAGNIQQIRDEDLDRIQKDIDRLAKEIEELENVKIDSTQLEGLLQEIRAIQREDGTTELESTPLQAGWYVVIESFRSAENAQRGVKLWQEKGREAIIVYDSERKWYYLYSKRFGNEKDARKEMRSTRKADVPDAWVHKYRVID
jgi:type IX secretion system PorP/SprF family membrane protein